MGTGTYAGHVLCHLTPWEHGPGWSRQLYLLLPCSQKRCGEQSMQFFLTRPWSHPAQMTHESLRTTCSHSIKAFGRHSLSLQILRILPCLQQLVGRYPGQSRLRLPVPLLASQHLVHLKNITSAQVRFAAQSPRPAGRETVNATLTARTILCGCDNGGRTWRG